MPALTVAEITEACGGAARGDLTRLIESAATLEIAGPYDVAFVASPKARAAALQSQAGCLIVDNTFTGDGAWSLVEVADPRRCFARVLALLYPKRTPLPGIHPSAVVATSAHVAENVSVGAFTTIGEGAEIASGCQIGHHVHIGERVRIGPRTTLHSNVTVYDGVTIGARVILHSGCVIGADGFGFALDSDHYEKFPQVGTVLIEDDVEAGANTCIDRAALGVTRIGAGTKLDNLVHIAHNCSIGKHVVIAAQTGFAGGVVVGDYAVVGGQVGAGEKAVIATRAVVGSGAGILSFQHIKAGEPFWGTPARPLKKHLRGLANVNRIDELRNAVQSLRARLDDLQKKDSAE